MIVLVIIPTIDTSFEYVHQHNVVFRFHLRYAISEEKVKEDVYPGAK